VERTGEAALAAAREELYERRAVTTARWYSQIPDDTLPKDFTAALARQNLALRCWRLRSPHAGTAVLAELRGGEGHAYGVASGPEHERTLLHAIEEACLMFSYRCEKKSLLPELQFADHGVAPDPGTPLTTAAAMGPVATWTWSDDELRTSGLVLGLAVSDADSRAPQTLPSWIFEGTA
jgi:hypothetical protein